MKKRTVFSLLPSAVISVAVLIAFAVISSFYDYHLMVFELIAAVVVAAITGLSFLFISKSTRRYFSSAAQAAQKTGTGTLTDFVLPIMVTNKRNEIVWYNESFRSSLLKGNDIFAESDSMFFGENNFSQLSETGKTTIDYKDRKYNVFMYEIITDDEHQCMFFFIDDTKNFKLAQAYKKTRPCMMFINVDGLEILLKNAKESQKTEIKGEIERQIEMITQISSGYLQKISSRRYLLVTDYSGYENMKNDKFSVLSKVRSLQFSDMGNATLSIGVGLGGNLQECVEYAENALDMALGRGGDQAVIKNREEFTFFGGITQSVQGNNRVRARVISATLKKLIVSAENVLIMGHSFSDMDSVGAGFAMCCAVRELHRSSKLIVDEEKSLAKPLINHLKKNVRDFDYIVSPDEAKHLVNEKTLLIIVDTHRPSVLESSEIYKMAQKVVVIDHHRQTVDFIDNSLLFYHDPSSSSTSEMVTVLLQYIGSDLIGRWQAEALLAGIALDTHDFVMKMNTDTYEALGYLRSKGANPVNVKRLFSDDLETYTARANIVSNATFYKHFAVSHCPSSCKNARIASSQAADELLTIKNVDASFVMYKDGSDLCISARSYGAANVQLIMESMGGGGHQTMAAVQLDDCGFEQASVLLREAIDKYCSDNR